MSNGTPQSETELIPRLPDGMRDGVEKAATLNGRSIDEEILKLIERQYPSRSKKSMDELFDDLRAAAEGLATWKRSGKSKDKAVTAYNLAQEQLRSCIIYLANSQPRE